MRVLEYGCGTGPAACFLAARGYQVSGIDLVPDAIDIARRHAAERNLTIRFTVADICQWDNHTEDDAAQRDGTEHDDSELHDLLLDGYCLQSIVTDRDRSRVLDGVRRRMKPDGRYMLSTAMFETARDYGLDRYDPRTGIVLKPRTTSPTTPTPDEDGRWIGSGWSLPYRRHLTRAALRTELEGHGLRIVEQSEAGGDVVCVIEPPLLTI